jgi:hypothetical protein
VKLGEATRKLSEERLRTWIRRDRTGLRKEILRAILELKEFGAEDLRRYLVERGFEVKITSLRSILGHLDSRVGIIRKRASAGRYELRSDLLPIVRRLR